MFFALVIEESKLISWSLKELLSNEGFGILTVDSYKTALNIAEKLKFHVIIADCEQSEPEKIEAIKKIHTLQPDSSLVILTSDKQNHTSTLFQDIPMLYVIEKPFHTETIQAIAKAALELK